MKTKDITPAQYAKYYNCSPQNITKHIRNGNILSLPYIFKLKNFGRFYLLEVPFNLTEDTFRQDLIKYNKSHLGQFK